MAKSHRKDLTHGPIGPILYKLTGPMVIGILTMVLFNAIDTYFVGRLGKNELSALSFTFAPIIILFTLVQGIGVGATALIAKSIGANDLKKAARETTDSLVLGLIVAIIFSVLGFLVLEPLFKAMGATEQELPLILEYMHIWLVAICFVVIPFVGNSAIRATGDAWTPTKIMLFAVTVNAILDPLLIFGYGPFPELGIRGAALATAISRGLTLVLSVGVLYRREKLITLVIPAWKTLRGCWAAILKIGVPAGLSRMIVPIANLMVYGILARLENPFVVAGYGVATRIEMLITSVLFALASTMGPFAGQNFSQGNYGRILEANNKSNVFSIGWGVVMGLVLLVFSANISGLFTPIDGVVEVASLYLVIVPITVGFQGVVQVVNTTLNTLNRSLLASGIIAVQMFVFYLPLSYFGAEAYQEQGVFMGIAFSYFIGGIISLVVVRSFLQKQREESLEAVPAKDLDSWEKRKT